MDTINLQTLTIEQLEALAYRLVEQQSNLNNNLALVQQELTSKRTERPKGDEETKTGS